MSGDGIIWPDIGSKWMDTKGRILKITSLQTKDVKERHIIGKIKDSDYACSLIVFNAIWRDRPLYGNNH